MVLDINSYNMGLFKEVELIIPPKKQNTSNKTVKVKSLSGYDAIREKLDEGNTMTACVSDATPTSRIGNET